MVLKQLENRSQGFLGPWSLLLTQDSPDTESQDHWQQLIGANQLWTAYHLLHHIGADGKTVRYLCLLACQCLTSSGWRHRQFSSLQQGMFQQPGQGIDHGLV